MIDFIRFVFWLLIFRHFEKEEPKKTRRVSSPLGEGTPDPECF